MTEMAYQTVLLEKLQVGARIAIAPLLMDAKVDVTERVLGELAVSIRGFVWAEKESVRCQKVKYPRDWWQAFKDRWFPKWACSRWPIRYKTVVLNVRAIYPTFRPAVPSHEVCLRITRTDSIEGLNEH